VLVRLKRADGKLASSPEEDREYSVAPEPAGVKREMVHFAGKYGVGDKEFPISEPGEKYKDTDIDADLAKSLADDFGNDEQSRDGINLDLFPLTAKKQKGLICSKRRVRKPGTGVPCFESHSSRERTPTGHHWAGEALIDKADLTPVLITTRLAHGIPVLVKTLLGTNIRQLGFKSPTTSSTTTSGFP
jgi:hypothetical protein